MEVILGSLQVIQAVVAVAERSVYHGSLHAIAQSLLQSVGGFLVALKVVIDVRQVHVGPKVGGVDAEGKLIGVDGLFVLSHHAIAVADGGPSLAVMRIFVDELLEKGDGILVTMGAEITATDVVIDGVVLVGVWEGFLIEVYGQIKLLKTLVFVGYGIVEIELLILVKVRQGAAIALDGFLRLAEKGEA